MASIADPLETWQKIHAEIRRKVRGKEFVDRLRLIHVSGDAFFVAVPRNGRMCFQAQQHRSQMQHIATKHGIGGIIPIAEPDDYELQRMRQMGGNEWDQFPSQRHRA